MDEAKPWHNDSYQYRKGDATQPTLIAVARYDIKHLLHHGLIRDTVALPQYTTKTPQDFLVRLDHLWVAFIFDHFLFLNFFSS